MQTFNQYLTEKQAHVDALIKMVKRGDFGSSKDLLAYLNEKQYVGVIGSGWYSVAFERWRGGQYILKTPHIEAIDAGRAAIDPWVRFAPVAQKSASNPLFPKILFFWEFADGTYCGIVERLRMIGDELDHKFRDIAVDLLMATGWNPADLLHYGPFNWFSLLVYGQLFRGENVDFLQPWLIRSAEYLNVEPVELEDYIQTCASIGVGQWDIHSGNVGMRGKQPVFFDPLARLR